MSSYYTPCSTFEYLKIGRDRIQFLENLMAILRAGNKPPVGDWPVLFEYYKIGSYFKEESVALLIFDFYTIANYIPFIIDSQIAHIMGQIIKTETPLDQEQFVAKFSSSTTLLIQIYDYLDIKDTSVNANNKFAILQVILEEKDYDKFKPSSFYESLKEKIRDLLKTDENTVFKITGVKNPPLLTFDYIVELVKPINLFSLPPIFVFENAQKISFNVQSVIYGNEILPLNHHLYPCDSVLWSSAKNVGNVLGNTASDLDAKLGVSKTLEKGKNFVSDQYVKFRNSEAVKNTVENVGGFFENVKNKITGEEKK